MGHRQGGPSRPEHLFPEYSHTHVNSVTDKNGNTTKNKPQQRSNMIQQRSTSVVGTTLMMVMLSLTHRKMSLPEQQRIGFQFLTPKTVKKIPLQVDFK